MASSGRCAVSVWGAVSKDGLGPLVRLEGRFNAGAYRDLIDNTLLPYALNGPFPDGLFYFQQDRSPVHTAASVTRLMEERGIMTLEWPPQGADMNVTENIWGVMKRSMSRRPLHRASVDDLWAAVEAEWNRLAATNIVSSLFNSLSHRMAAVVAARGDMTKY